MLSLKGKMKNFYYFHFWLKPVDQISISVFSLYFQWLLMFSSTINIHCHRVPSKSKVLFGLKKLKMCPEQTNELRLSNPNQYR